MPIRRSTLIFVGCAVLYLVLFAFIGYSEDGDGIANQPFNGSIHVLVWGELSRLGLGGAMRFVYALVFAQMVTGHIVRREWERVLFFASPFVLANATDIYNRFMLCLVCAQLIDWGLRTRHRWIAAAAGIVFASTHPFNAAFLLGATAPLLSPLVVLTVVAIAQIANFDVLGPLFSDKRALLHTYGWELPTLSQGNYAINPALRGVAFGVVWWLAVLLPGIGTAVSPPVAYGVAGFHVLWIAAILALTPYRRTMLLAMLPMTVLVALFVGNSAVGYRHLLPIFYAALMIFGRSPPSLGRGFAFGLVRLRLGGPREAPAGASGELE
ncbi:MAG: hypothetical protein ACHP84_13745 [Caulobacterales bacterium]